MHSSALSAAEGRTSGPPPASTTPTETPHSALRLFADTVPTGGLNPDAVAAPGDLDLSSLLQDVHIQSAVWPDGLGTAGNSTVLSLMWGGG